MKQKSISIEAWDVIRMQSQSLAIKDKIIETLIELLRNPNDTNNSIGKVLFNGVEIPESVFEALNNMAKISEIQNRIINIQTSTIEASKEIFQNITKVSESPADAVKYVLWGMN